MHIHHESGRDVRGIADRLKRAVAAAPPPELALFLAAVSGAALLSLLIPPAWTAAAERWLPALVALTVAAIALEFVSVPLPKGGSITVATIPHLAILLLVPAPWAAVAVAASVFVEEAVRRVPAPKFLFNVAGMLLTSSLCSLALGFAGSVWAIRDSAAPQVLLLVPFVVVGALYHGVNLLLTSVVFALASGRSFGYVLRVNTRGTLLNDAGATAVGALAALVWTVEPLLASLLALPAAVVSRSFQHTRRLEAETRSAVRSLAEIIDDRDASTYHHSGRVAVYSLAIGRELGLADEELELIEQAASVHDLGKIGIPDRVLLKTEPLDAAEFAAMKLHTEIGPRVLTQFQLFADGAAIVRHHHESYDGSGYPDGLAGDAIPFGARLVAVADAFDAMTSDRPYRAALSTADALARLRAGRGQQWDPVLIDAFMRAFEAGAIQQGAAPSPTTIQQRDARAPHAPRVGDSGKAA